MKRSHTSFQTVAYCHKSLSPSFSSTTRDLPLIMEVSTSSSSEPESIVLAGMEQKRKGRVTRKTLKAVLEECQKALELLKIADLDAVADEEDGVGDKEVESGEVSESTSSQSSLSSLANDSEADEICNLLRSRIESPQFLEKLGSIQLSIPQNVSAGEDTSWDVVTASDLWDNESIDRDSVAGEDGYILVDKEDIADGIACFMAAYLLSLKQTKDLSPNQLQEALSRTFSVKKKKGKLRKAWDGSKVVYNVASWGATAIGIYQNPALLKAASAAFWTSCRVISQLF